MTKRRTPACLAIVAGRAPVPPANFNDFARPGSWLLPRFIAYLDPFR